MNNHNSEPKSSLSSPQSLIFFMEHSQDSWWIKDNQSRYIHINIAGLDCLNIPKDFNPEGKLDKDIPIKSCQELWPEFVEHDQKVMRENRMISAIEIHYYGKGNLDNPVPRRVDKAPLYDGQSNIIGTVGHGRIIDSSTLLYYMHRFNRKIIEFDAPNDVFTKKELEVIFWALQRLSSKEIAKRLGLSPRTVETKLQLIYEKAGIHCKSQLMEYCKHTGLDAYIPANFVRKGVQLVE